MGNGVNRYLENMAHELDKLISEALVLVNEKRGGHRTDCFFFELDRLTESTIGICRNPECGESFECQDCPCYITKTEADDIIREYISRKRVENEEGYGF